MQTFNTSIFEDIPSDFSITRLTARDDDSGLFGRLEYSISQILGGTELNATFTIDETSGIVRTEGTFDREVFGGPYIITVRI